MTHAPESEFVAYLGEVFMARYGAENVEREKWLDRTGCYADFWIDPGYPETILAIEVENDAGSIRNGVGQALEYAQNHPRAVPVVYTPKGHVEQTQADALRQRGVPIIEVVMPEVTNGDE